MKNHVICTRIGFAILAALLALPSNAEAQRRKDVVVGIVSDGKSDDARATAKAIKLQVKELGASKYNIKFPDDKHIDGEFDSKKISAGLDALLADPAVTIIYALGPLASHQAGQRASLSKPVIAPFIIDRKLQGMPFKKGKSGRKNLNYLDWPWSVERDLAVLNEVAAPKKVVALAAKYATEAIRGLGAQATQTAKSAGFEMSLLAVDRSVDDVLKAIPNDVDGVYLAPLPQLSPAQMKDLLERLHKRRIPTFALQGERAVRGGVLVGRLPNESINRIARRVALHTQRILSGEDAGRLSVSLKLPERVFINMRTARTIGISPNWQILTEAELVDVARKDIKRKLSLPKVMNEALSGNLNIKALEQVVVAGRASVRGARANLLPTLQVSSDGRVIDKDRAETGFGNSPQFLLDGTVSLSQVLFSEPAWAGFTSEKFLQRNRRQQLVQTKLDVIAEVSSAYLTVLRAKAAERIQRNNLKVTRANLELARIRVDAGSTNRAEVYRWEVQIANDRKSLIQASAQRNVAEIDVARILHRPVEEPFSTAEVPIPKGGLAKYVGDPQSFRLLRHFMVEESIRNSPEIKQLDAAIAAQSRGLKSAKRRLFAPSLALQASATQRLYRGGAGTEPFMGANEPDGLQWFVGLNLSIPLYAGGSRYAEIDRNRAEVSRLTRERDFARDRVAQRTASQLHLAGSSFAGIRLANQAEESAKKNFDLVAKAYGEGAVRVVELLDAQRAWVSAQQLAVDSVYGFLIDWINVQRAMGAFFALSTKDERQDFVKRGSEYIEQRRARRVAP